MTDSYRFNWDDECSNSSKSDVVVGERCPGRVSVRLSFEQQEEGSKVPWIARIFAWGERRDDTPLSSLRCESRQAGKDWCERQAPLRFEFMAHPSLRAAQVTQYTVACVSKISDRCYSRGRSFTQVARDASEVASALTKHGWAQREDGWICSDCIKFLALRDARLRVAEAKINHGFYAVVDKRPVCATCAHLQYKHCRRLELDHDCNSDYFCDLDVVGDEEPPEKVFSHANPDAQSPDFWWFRCHGCAAYERRQEETEEVENVEAP